MDLLERHSHSTRKVAFGHITENSKDKLEPLKLELVNVAFAAVELQEGNWQVAKMIQMNSEATFHYPYVAEVWPLHSGTKLNVGDRLWGEVGKICWLALLCKGGLQ